MEAQVVLADVSRAVMLTLRSGMPAALAAVEAEWQAKDAAFYGALGEAVPATPLSAPKGWFLNYNPDLLEQHPLDQFPLVIVVCLDQEPPTTGTDGDQFEVSGLPASVEAWVASTDFEQAGRMAERYAQAVNHLVGLSDTLDGVVDRIESSMRVRLSQPYVRYDEADKDTYTYLQGCRLEYTFRVSQLA